MDSQYIHKESGQNVVLIAIMMLALIALLALVLDGGMGYAQRRAAQNAADAGALAGANYICIDSPDTAAAAAAAWDYAVTRNQADNADIWVRPNGIAVTTTITTQTFFAGLIGRDQVTVTASASASCFAPCSGVGVLPVAWACSPPVGGEDGCAIQYGTETTPGPIYVVMDSNKAEADYSCQDPPNSGLPDPDYLDCDLDNDGVDDLLTGGGRSWLNLDGGSCGAADLKSWVSGGYSDPLDVHTWLPECNGTDTSIFIAAASRVGDIVILPVFNDYCKQGVPNVDPLCIPKVHPEDIIKLTSGGSFDYYHVISFSLFKITGVSKNSGSCVGNCWGKAYLVDNDVLDHNAKTIEGYFIEGYDPDLSGGCHYDAGGYTIYLDK